MSDIENQDDLTPEADAEEIVVAEGAETEIVEGDVVEIEDEAEAEEEVEAEAEAEEEAEEEEPAKKAKDQAPGANLEPLALEPEVELDAEERARLEAEEEEQRARAEAEAAAYDDAPIRTEPKVKLAKDATIQATGKRKNSIARVVVRAGDGKFLINQREIEEYFPREHLQTVARQALALSGYDGTLDIKIRVHGGGIAGQAGAVRHGVAKALCEIDPELRGDLKRRGFLTRDARIKERKKAGFKKARKKPQFSKR